MGNVGPRGFTMLEAIVSTVIIVIFLVGSIKFFDAQNAAATQMTTLQISQDLADEAQLSFSSMDYASIPAGNYSLWYTRSANTGILNPSVYQTGVVTADTNTNEKGKFVFADGQAVELGNFDGQSNERDIYKRIITVEDGSYAFPYQSIKKIRIRIWDPFCAFEGDPCTTRDFIRYSDQ